MKRIVSGDEFLCLQEYRIEIENCPAILRPVLHISRSSKDSLPEGGNYFFVAANYVHKNSQKTYDYIKPHEYNKLQLSIHPYSKYSHLVPISEFRDLKNPSYTVLACDLLAFHSNVVPFLQNKGIYKIDSAYANVFEFVEQMLTGNINIVLEKYKFVFSDKCENYLWVLDSTIDTCISILAKTSARIHPYQLQKYTPIAKNIGIDDLFFLKGLVGDIMMALRENNNYIALKKLAEFASIFYNVY
jgi:hypothetical protein